MSAIKGVSEMKPLTVDVSKIMQSQTMNVKVQVDGIWALKIRLWIAIKLINFSARILGCKGGATAE